MKRSVGAFSLLSLLLVQGCLYGAAIAVGEHAVKKGFASKKEEVDSYDQYISQMQGINCARENNSLPPLPILSKEDWMRQSTFLKKIEEDKRSQSVQSGLITPEEQ